MKYAKREMKMDNVIRQIKDIAKKNKVDKVVLFGSRARGDDLSSSDYDIAVYTHDDTSLKRAIFCNDIDEIKTLRKIDVVFVSEKLSNELKENISKDGIVIYE